MCTFMVNLPIITRRIDVLNEHTHTSTNEHAHINIAIKVD